MLKTILIYCLALLPLTAFAANGTEGVLENNQIFVRDLYESGTHLNPWFGIETSQDIKARWSSMQVHNQFANEEALILRKLTDLEARVPGLGFAVVESIDLFKYRFVKVLPSNTRYVQITTRQLFNVSISKVAWDSMSTEGKASLLIREGLFSLGNLACVNNDCAIRDGAMSLLIGQSFTATPTFNYAHAAFQHLGIRSLERMCEYPSMRVAYGVWAKENRGGEISYISLGSVNANYFRWPDPTFDDVQLLCEKAAAKKSPGKNIMVSFDAENDRHALTYEYFNSNGLKQLHAFTAPNLNRSKVFIEFTDVANCKKEMTALVSRFVAPSQKYPVIQPLKSCQ